MKILLIVGLGSFIGGVTRYLVSLFVQSKFTGAFPYGTLAVNVAGCLLIGLLYGLSEKMELSRETRFFISTGLLGGFTTFSAFSIDTFTLIKNDQAGPAALYVATTLLVGLLATFVGYYVSKIF